MEELQTVRGGHVVYYLAGVKKALFTVCGMTDACGPGASNWAKAERNLVFDEPDIRNTGRRELQVSRDFVRDDDAPHGLGSPHMVLDPAHIS
jgi:hypothetical protein